MRCAYASRMGRLLLLTLLLLSSRGRAQDGGVPLDDARKLMREGLERDVPAPSLQRPEWPRAELTPPGPREQGNATSQERLDALSDKVKTDAALRARAVAEERRTVPDNQPGVSQSRTRAAKTQGPVKPRPPRP